MPFEDAYARLTAAHGSLHVRLGPPSDDGGWVRASDLVGDPAMVRGFIAAEGAEREQEYGTPLRPDVAASFALHRYAWPACLLMSVPWFLDRRVPRVPVDTVAFHPGTRRVIVDPVGFSCLPGDPAADLPGARVVPDEEALRAELRAAVAEHMAPVLTAFRPHLKRGPRAMWGLATDELSEGLWYLGYLFGQEDRAVAELTALLPGGTPPFPAGAGFRPATTAPAPSALPGGSAPPAAAGHTRTRLSCCLYYTVRPDDACATCPRTCGSERLVTAGARPGAA